MASAASAIAFTVVGAASAAPSAVASLEWTAPPECPRAADVQARVAAIVGPALADSSNARIAVVRTGEGKYAATVRVRVHGREGERSLEESSCAVLADAAAAVVAVSLIAEASAPAADPAPPPPRVEEPAPPPARPHDPRFALGVLATVDYGTLPSTAAGGGLEAAYYPLERLRIEASFVRWFAQSGVVGGQDFGGRFQLTSGDARACFALFGRSLTLGPCAGIGVEHIDADGAGSTSTNAGSATYWSPLVGALLRWTPARWLGVLALVDVAFPITRPSFVIDRVPAGVEDFTIYTPAAEALRGQLAAEVRF